MTVISGKDAYVDGVPCTTSWSASYVAATQPYAASCTDGGTGIVEGNINWAGNMAGLGPNPPVIPGQEFAFKGVIDATAGDALTLDGTVLVESVAVNLPVAGGGPITWTAVFGVQGALISTTTGAIDATHNLATSAKDAEVLIDPAGAAIEVENVQNITLNFAAPSVTYVNDGLTLRKSGNLSGGISFAVLDRDIFVVGYQPNDRKIVHVTIGDGTEWILDEIVFGSITDFSVDVATRAIVGYTVNGQWSAVSDLTGGTLGTIVMPDTTVWFPEA